MRVWFYHGGRWGESRVETAVGTYRRLGMGMRGKLKRKG